MLSKKSELFPKLKINSDLDIIVRDKKKFEQNLNTYFKSYKNINISKVKENQINSQYDIFIDNQFYIKFDIHYKKFESKNVNLKKNFYDQLFKNPEQLNFKFHDESFSITTPALEFEILIRFLEFLINPNKTHHKHFINHNISRLENPEHFLGEYIDVDLDNSLNRNRQIYITELFAKKVLKKITNMIKGMLLLESMH